MCWKRSNLDAGSGQDSKTLCRADDEDDSSIYSNNVFTQS